MLSLGKKLRFADPPVTNTHALYNTAPFKLNKQHSKGLPKPARQMI